MYFRSPAWTRSIECATATHIASNPMPVPVSSKILRGLLQSDARTTCTTTLYMYGCALVLFNSLPYASTCYWRLWKFYELMCFYIDGLYMYIHACTQRACPATDRGTPNPPKLNFPKLTSGSQQSIHATRMVLMHM